MLNTTLPSAQQATALLTPRSSDASVFGLITALPERVFRWVGGQGAQLGGGDERQARSSFAGAAAVVTRPQKLAGASAAAGGVAAGAVAVGSDAATGAGGAEGASGAGNRVAGGGNRAELSAGDVGGQANGAGASRE